MKHNNKIAMFCHDDPLSQPGSQEIGGQAVYVKSLVKELDKKGWSVDIFVRRDSQYKKQISLIRKKSRLIRLKGGPVKYVSRKLLFDYLPEMYDNFLEFINNQNPYSLFHGHYWDGGWLALKAHQDFSVPFVENFHSLGKIRFQTKEKYSAKENGKDIFDKRFLLEKELANKADTIISLSKSEKQSLKEKYDILPEKVKVISGGVNLKKFSPIPRLEARKKVSLNENEFIILFTGRLEWRKGIGALIHAASLLKEDIPNLKVIIVGGKIFGRQKNIDDFKEYQRLLGLAKDFKVENIISFVGCMDHERLPFFYSAADIFVVPSYYEPFGLVTVESMACKTPVIASDVDGLSNIIEHEKNGLLFEPRNSKDLKEKIKKIYQSKELTNEIIKNAYRDVIEKYSWNKIAEKIGNIYNSLIENNHKE